MLELPNWPMDNPKWDEINLDYLLNMKINKDLTNKKVSTTEIINNTDKFPIKFPVETVKIKNIKNYKEITEESLNRNANSVYALVHEKVLELFAKFLELKKKYGTVVERDLYKDMGLKDFVNRLIYKRAVCFYGGRDRWLLLNKAQGSGGWEKIGTELETEPLVLKDCLSYDEIKMSAFMYVSSYTYFLNKGDRYNKGIHNTSNVEQDGIIVGMIGARFKKKNRMDFEDICLNKKEKTLTNAKPSVSDLMKEFFEEEKTSSYWTNKNDARFTTGTYGVFDNIIYHKRLAIAFDSLLLEANFRAKEAGKSCYLHMVGIGLGVWMISKHQPKLFLDSFYNRILSLGEKIGNISDIYFAWFTNDNIGGVRDGGTIELNKHALGGIRVHFGQREPHEKLIGDNEGKLLVVSYAWDGNALPGNEFWRKLLSSSGDPAAACSTQIAELHNPHINPQLCADNLRIVCQENGEVLRLQEYQDRKKEKKRLIELLGN